MRIAAMVFALALGACASVRERIDEDAQWVDHATRDRIGLDPHLAMEASDASEIEAKVKELLGGGLTEDEAVRIALVRNAEVRAEYQSLGIASAELVQAGLWNNPVLDANAKFFDHGTEIELGLTQSFLDLFYLPLRKRVAESELEAAKVRITRRLVQLVFDVRRAFVDVRAAAELVALQRRAMDAAQASFELMQDLHHAGNVTDPQLTAQEASLSRARLAVAAAELAASEAREPLNVLLGLWGEDVAWTIDGKLEDAPAADADFEHVETRAVAASLDLAERRAHAESLARRAGLTSWEGIFSHSQIGVVAKREVGGEWGLGPSFAIDVPLWSRGSARDVAAQARLRQELDQFEVLGVEVRSAARTLRDRSIAISERARYLREVHLPLLNRFLKETLQNFNAMQIGAFEVLDAKEQELDAAREQLDTLREASRARLDLEELLAGSLRPDRLADAPALSSHDARTMKKDH